MALSDDQRAMLRLLAQREQGYDDLAALMGLSVDEVRAKVKDALDALEEGEVAPPLPPEPVAPPPVAPEPPKPEPPAAEEPAPEPAAAKPAPASPAAKRPSSPPRISLPSGQGARAAIAAAIAVVALIVVVVIVSGGSDSDTSTSTTTAATTPSESATTATTAGAEKETQAVLSEVDGSGASGTAIFGRVKNSLALQVVAEGLEPTSKGQSYTVWVADSPRKMLPLASTEAPKSGKIGAQFEVPTEVLAYLAKGTFDQIVVTATDEAQLKASLTKATKEKKSPVYTGTAVLRGPITGPIVGAASR